MTKSAPDFELLGWFDAHRPKDYRVQIVSPAGETTHDAVFGTKAEAQRYAKLHAAVADLVITHYKDRSARN